MNCDQIEKFSEKHVLYTRCMLLINCVIGAVPANFYEFSIVLVSFIEFGGITANFTKYMPKQAQFDLKPPHIAEIVQF